MAKRESANPLKKASKKKLVIRTHKSLDEKYLGPEPIWTDEEPTSIEIMRAYSWYNYFYTSKDAIKLLFDNLEDKKKVRELKKLSHDKIPAAVCYQAAMLARGCKLDRARFNSKIDELLALAAEIQEEKKEEKKEVAKSSVQDRVKEQISEFIAEIEEVVDTFTNNKYETDFNMYNWLRGKNIKAQQSNAIAEYYRPLLAELEEVGTCEQLTEAYSFMKKVELNRFITFIKMIVDDASTWGSNQKTVRKTRTKKPPSIEKQLKGLKFAQENKEYKLVSINPTNIIGATQLWVFNTKYRALAKYEAAGTSGLTIKGTTIQGFEESMSIVKRLRKPNDILPRVLSGGKRVLGKIFDEINSKESVPNGRINADTILLKVIK